MPKLPEFDPILELDDSRQIGVLQFGLWELGHTPKTSPLLGRIQLECIKQEPDGWFFGNVRGVIVPKPNFIITPLEVPDALMACEATLAVKGASKSALYVIFNRFRPAAEQMIEDMAAFEYRPQPQTLPLGGIPRLAEHRL